MVVIQQQRPRTGLQAAAGFASDIAKQIILNRQKQERDKQLQQLITGAKTAGQAVTTTVGPKGEVTGVSFKSEPKEEGFFDIGGQTAKTGTRAVTVGGQPTINVAQVLGGQPAAEPRISLGATPTVTPPAVPAADADPLQGLLVPEKGTIEKGPTKLTVERRPLETELERAGERKAQESLRSAQLKDVEKRKVNLRSSKLKLGNSLRSFVDVSRRTEKLTGAKPGPLGGSISAILGATKANEFVRGFQGGLTEVAAAVGATAIPNARAVRLVSLFKGTGIGRFDTIESGVQTTADSIVNGMSGDMAAAPWEYIFGNLKNERESKKAWDALTRQQQTEIVDTELPVLLEQFEDNFVSESLNTIFDEDPQLLGQGTIQRIEGERQTQRNTLTTPGGVTFTIN